MIEPDLLLLESQSKKAIEDDCIYGDLESAEECPTMDDVPCTADYYHQEVDYSVLPDDATQILEQEVKYEFADSMLQRVDGRDLHFTCNLPSMCNDYPLDSGYEEYTFLNGPSNVLKRSFSECQTASIKRDDNVGGVSNSSCAANPLAKKASLLDCLDDQKLHDAFKSTFGRDACVTDKQWLKHRILFGLQNLGEIDNVSGITESGLASTENEDNAILIPGSNLCERVYTFSTDLQDRRTLTVSGGVGRNGHLGKRSQRDTSEAIRVVPRLGLSSSVVAGTALISNKRLRKPTQRYIKEVSEMKSSCHNERLKTAVISSRDKFMHDITARQHFCKGESTLAYQECHIRRDHLGKVTSIVSDGRGQHMLCLVSPERSFPLQHSESGSLDDISDNSVVEIINKKIRIRRKHRRQWTLPEVVKLVDGVSQYGVGRWSEIKRELFPTSAFRTSVDLKDKWRNLLRASAQQLRNRNKESKHKFSIPKSELQRVRELSEVHSYPREQKSRLTSTSSEC